LRERLRIGEVARLVGVTTKTVRHYEKIGLLKRPERSEAGYRLYTADDLLEVHRIKRLRSLGLSLKRIKEVLGGSGSGRDLRRVLEALLGEVEERMGDLEERRDRLEEMLARDDLEGQNEPPKAVKLAEDLLGDLLEDVSPSLLEQEKRLWSTIESLEWPAAYMEDFMNIQESFLRYYAEHPDEYVEVLALSERIAALDELPEDSPEVERLLEDYVRYAKSSSLPQAAQRGPDWTAEPMGSVFFEIMTAGTSPARRRFFELCRERLEIPQNGDAE
jgi:DNA-binding transcriptional MerR regulator